MYGKKLEFILFVILVINYVLNKHINLKLLKFMIEINYPNSEIL